MATLRIVLAGFAREQEARDRRQARLDARAADAAMTAKLAELEQARRDNHADKLLDRVGSAAWL